MSGSLDKRLLAYTLAAGAGLAAAPELAEASIVYTNPSDISISTNGAFINIDLNNDGTADARVSVQESLFTEGGYDYANATAVVGGNGQPTGVIAAGGIAAAALTAGAPIGPAQTFANIQASTREMAHAYATNLEGGLSEAFGFFANAGDRFLGLTFQIGGVAHFGWARFNVTTEQGYSPGSAFAEVFATLKDYAFENCPREAIAAGAGILGEVGASCPSGVPTPPALALLALGASGLALWRAGRREE